MKKITKKDLRIMNLLNDFGYLGCEFFITLFHSRSNKEKKYLVYKIKKDLDDLITIGFVASTISEDKNIYYSLTPEGRAYIYRTVDKLYVNSVTINSGKFKHSQYCALVYAKLAARYNVFYRSENSLSQNKKTKIVPDLAIKINETIIYFEVERTLKSETLIREKLSNYNKNFKDGWVVYLTGNSSIIRKIERIKHRYSNYEKIKALNLIDFLNDPELLFKSINQTSAGLI